MLQTMLLAQLGLFSEVAEAVVLGFWAWGLPVVPSVDTWALKGLLYPDFGLYSLTMTLLGAFEFGSLQSSGSAILQSFLSNNAATTAATEALAVGGYRNAS